ncbi:MAG: DUF5110 domain-containing protein [Ignavibacteria bacterium]|nr:DUF5110 domain-containing protein [Ignavibacteria bacterium]MCU7501631.1 DUF5110 domain-containing protein [Ignavibacteria bacterium]MCU7517780.1 DUF5110 domain-containing protein [Ignavibacteria bacterium]
MTAKKAGKQNMSSMFYRSIALAVAVLLVASPNISLSQERFERNDSSVTVRLPAGGLQIVICSGNVIRILHGPKKTILPRTSLSVINSWNSRVPFEVSSTPNSIIIETDKLQIIADPNSGAVTFSDSLGNILLHENPASAAIFTPAVVLGERTYNAQLNLEFTPDEGIYGLGQFQDGLMNYRGHEETLVQENTRAVVPFILSTKKYGLLLDNYSKIRFKDREDSTYFYFEVADNIDYYFISGHDMDEVIMGYRLATGRAPMYSRWAYGYFQSKERYKTQNEILNAARKFRELNIPVDCIVQDWQYWGDDNRYWNAMRFDSVRYPDPRGMIDSLHRQYHTHLMVSIWPVAGQRTELYNELYKNGLLYQPYHWTDGHTYDAYSSLARKIYWNEVNKGLFSLGVDAFWMDATEPEVVLAPTERSIKEARSNALGTMARYLNPYSLMTTKAVYEGQRAADPSKRVYILTRSAFLGQQRNAATTWSGDIVANWLVFRNQIPAGLNFSMSGIPYWTNDIGGFHVSRYGGFPGGADDPGYRELYVRWFQFGAFNPIFRSHGTDVPREPWTFGKEGDWAYEAIVKYDRLRYRLLPYIYSLAYQVEHNGYTIMRGLVMDFPSDTCVFHIADQFMFGPSIMVNPVTEHMYYGEGYENRLIPPSCLKTPEGKPGFYRAEYFSGTNFDTLKVDSLQSETLFDLYLGRDLPPQVNWEKNSMRWTGSFRSLSAGEYELWLTSDDAVRFFMDGNEILDGWNNKGIDTTYRILMPLDAGCWHTFKIEFARLANSTKLRFAWKTPGMVLKHYDPSRESGIRSVYLPEVQGGWYDFWTGEHVLGGKTLRREVPIDIIPLYVKAGSIIPMGPDLNYASEKSGAPIEIRVYTGADAAFDLYDDEGDNYNYEKGAYSIVPIRWSEKEQKLTIGQRTGSFPGMPEKIKLNIIWVNRNSTASSEISQKTGMPVLYEGKKVEISK